VSRRPVRVVTAAGRRLVVRPAPERRGNPSGRQRILYAMDPEAIARIQAEYKAATVGARERRRKGFRAAQRAGMSMAQIGRAAGLSKGRVQQILRGE